MLAHVGLFSRGLLRHSEHSEQRGTLSSLDAAATAAKMLEWDALHRVITSEMGSAEWHALAIDGFLDEDLEYDAEPGRPRQHQAEEAVVYGPETPTEVLSNIFFDACVHEHISFETEVDSCHGNGTADVGLSLVPIKWAAPDSLLQCPPGRPKQYGASYNTKPCQKGLLTAVFMIEAIERDRQAQIMAGSDQCPYRDFQHSPGAGFALAAHDRNIQVLYDGGFDPELVASLLNTHVAWYSGPVRFLNPEGPVCTHLLPTPYETGYDGVIIADEDVVDKGGSVYWERPIDDIAQSAPVAPLDPPRDGSRLTLTPWSSPRVPTARALASMRAKHADSHPCV